jgi:hypothetical protein
VELQSGHDNSGLSVVRDRVMAARNVTILF